MALGITLTGKGLLSSSIGVSCISTETIPWDIKSKTLNFLPNNTEGVYIVYGKIDRYDNEEPEKTLYVGETGNNYRVRFQGHDYRAMFVYHATKVVLLKFNPDQEDERVLYEKAKILDLNPVFNKPRTDKKQKIVDQFAAEIANDEYLNTLLQIGYGSDDEVLEVYKNIKKGLI